MTQGDKEKGYHCLSSTMQTCHTRVSLITLGWMVQTLSSPGPLALFVWLHAEPNASHTAATSHALAFSPSLSLPIVWVMWHVLTHYVQL